MKYLNQVRFSTVIIQDRQTIRFIVPVELAALIFLFLSSRLAQTVALVTWWLIRDMAGQWRAFGDYLKGWRADLVVIRLAVLDLCGFRVAFVFG